MLGTSSAFVPGRRPATQNAGPNTPDRVQEVQHAGLTERRRYHLASGPEYLAETLESGTESDGRLLRRRTRYYPWGPIRWQITQHGDESVIISYFPNGELRQRKSMRAGFLTDYFRWSSPGPPYTYTEQMPKYPGGSSQQVVRDIQQAVTYPAQALRNREEGRIVVAFTVTDQGLVTNIHVTQSVSASLDEAACRAVARVGERRWQPGFQNQRAVSVEFSVPLTCRIK